MEFRNKRVLIFGLGQYREGSGVSAAKFFIRRGSKVTVTDLKKEKDLKRTVRLVKGKAVLVLGRHRMSDVRNTDIIIRNPGVPNHSPYLVEARRRKIPIYTDVSLFMQLCPCPVIGITGTRGKSTTTALVGEIMRLKNSKTFVGGNIQRSPLTFFHRLDKNSLVVLELSSWLAESLADIRQSPEAAAVTNIYRDHLNIHGSMAAYLRAKEQIFRFQKAGDILALNRDNQYTRKMVGKFDRDRNKDRIFWFSMKPLPRGLRGAWVKDGWIMVDGRRVMAIDRLRLKGKHNVANALAAAAVAAAMSVPIKKIARVLRTFAGLAYRQEIVRLRRGVAWINDTTATTPEATMAALERFSKNPKLKTQNPKPRLVLIAGGTDKKLQFTELARVIKKYCKFVVLLDGTATDKLSRLLPVTSYQLPVTVANSMRQAVQTARSIAERGDIVLLSPGAASFGLFKNEFDRGDQFNRLVRRLP
ncbi:UDP-N-acetylmuramoyl-L-alanine--D-glutamate ligase [Candidatus Uhrbacteria bacterium]|nr:UDP-N-acetylmuramoyl-L-alanine--D-glutamate ligase [Candidatus Uhrbacteria bacterium]